MPAERLIKAPLTFQRQGKLELLPKGGSWANYCLADQSKSKMKAHIIQGNDCLILQPFQDTPKSYPLMKLGGKKNPL